MKALKIFLALIIVILIIYLLGPKPEDFTLDTNKLPTIQDEVSYVQKDINTAYLRKDNEAKLIYHSTDSSKTEFVFLYIHGFSASEKEGAPINRNIPEIFNSNAFLTRLVGHGINYPHSLEDYNVADSWESAKVSLAIAKKMGEKVIIIGTSTGCTYGLMLASYFPKDVHAVINLSPNLRINSPFAGLLNNPWGKEIAGLVYGENRHIRHENATVGQYWDSTYTVNAMVQLQDLLESEMTEEVYRNIQCPMLSLYYYKSDQEQDDIIDVSAIAPMHSALRTPTNQQRMVAIPEAGDHVIGSDLKSKDWQSVQSEIKKFCIEILKIESYQ